MKLYRAQILRGEAVNEVLRQNERASAVKLIDYLTTRRSARSSSDRSFRHIAGT